MKYYGQIGFRSTSETKPGVWEPIIVEHSYYGDVIKNSKRFQGSDRINENLDVNNQISIVADPFARNHFHEMIYIKWMGAAWKITSVDVQFPRLILSIGGVYNGNEPNQ